MRSLFILIISLISISLNAAAPVFHAIISEMYLEKYPERDSQEFTIGTLFPDIRYLANIKREITHAKSMSLRQIQEEKSSFQAGLMLHSFVDLEREAFANRSGIYNSIPKFSHLEKKTQLTVRATLLKLIEDEVLYNSLNHDKIISYLSKTSIEQLKYVPLKMAKKWHENQIHYLQVLPSELIQEKLLDTADSSWNITRADLQKFPLLIETLSKDPKIIDYVMDQIKQFQTKIEDFERAS